MFGAMRISFGRDRVEVGVVPIAAPFVDIVADVVKAEGVGGVLCNPLGAFLPARGIVGERLRGGVTPGEGSLFEAASSREFPFRFSGQAIGAGSLGLQPFAVAGGFMPRHRGHGLLGTIKVWVPPERRRCAASCDEKARIFVIRDLGSG